MSTTTLRALGFCGADDSVHPNMLVLLATAYPVVEFGILFRPDKEGTPRYASPSWVQRLVAQKPTSMKLAAHLCSTRVNEVLAGNGSFVTQLQEWGFQRIQINATAVNGVDTANMGLKVGNVLKIMLQHPSVEFIVQKNDETEPLWQGLLNDSEASAVGKLPSNVCMLLDESKGTGVLADSWPAPPADYDIGYAGGIGPDTIGNVLQKVQDVTAGRSVWIDMESRLRSIKNDCDVFDLDKCYTVLDAVCGAGLAKHPAYLNEKA